ncbi:MAG TPA: hypothetical protein VFC31_14605 [Candidatus Limnocylindria bacterium]|nr:hypothetical protein [Candidatus Limnocylindria bacterium]
MGLLAFSSLVIVGLIAGFAVQYLAKGAIRGEWLIVAVAVVFGGYFASESFPGSTVFEGIKDWGPTFDGMAIIPAIVGALILGIVADLGMRASPDVQPAS